MNSKSAEVKIEEKLVATTYLNGEKIDATVLNGQNIGKFAQELASKHGIRSFTVSVDDTRLTPSTAASRSFSPSSSSPERAAETVSVTAKDSRGSNSPEPTEPTPTPAPEPMPEQADGHLGATEPTESAVS